MSRGSPPPHSRLRRQVPAWAMSCALHAIVLALLGWTWRHAPRGAAEEPARTAGIVLVEYARGERQYFDQDAAAGSLQSSMAREPEVSPWPAAEGLSAELSRLLSTAELPRLGPGAVPPTSAPRVGQLGNEGTADGNEVGGQVRTQVFGIYGEGTRFVYVFDRSGSMDGFGGRPLRAAKAELLASLRDLRRIHQFQIVFYNEAPRVFNPHGGRPRLEWADEASQQLAAAFVRGISAAGGTRHLDALRLALGLNPDVIFFLTDADEPELTESELQRLHSLNRGSVIHAVEFGFGSQKNRENFLVRLARQNGGQHTYVNIAQLPAE